MKRLWLILILSLSFSTGYAVEQVDLADHPACKDCGMTRGKFAYSRLLISYENGVIVPTCSLHCAALDLANSLNHSPLSIKVADYDSQELIDAQTAVWVVGGSRPGVMSTRGKWAFSSRAQAESFLATAGGTIVTFPNAVKASYEDMYQDTLMLREKLKSQGQNKP